MTTSPDALRRVLVIDDSEDVHAEYRELLGGSAGPALDLAFSFQGEDGWRSVCEARAAGRPFAMAFVDMRMPPGWDGIETTHCLLRDDPEIQVVIATGYPGDSWEGIVERIGPTDRLLVLGKPFERVELRQMTHALVRKWNTMRQVRATLDAMSQRVIERTRELAARNIELERAIAALHEKQSQLIHSEKLSSVGRLAAGIAHEVNTPIQYIGDNVSFLSECFGHCSRIGEAYRELLAAASASLSPDALSKAEAVLADADLDYLLEEVPAALAQTREGIARVIHVVGAMKGFANPAATTEPFDVNQCIEDTITVASGEWKQVAVVDTDLDPALPALVGDRSSLSQVILNLIVNASDAIAIAQTTRGGPKGSIRIVTRRCTEGVEIRVSDSGCGIRDEIRGRIFEPFFTTKEVGRGTGQGLAVAWDVVVEKHLGSIEVESQAGQGSIFVLRLPAAQ